MELNYTIERPPRRMTNTEIVAAFAASGRPAARLDGWEDNYSSIASAYWAIKLATREYVGITVTRRKNQLYLSRELITP